MISPRVASQYPDVRYVVIERHKGVDRIVKTLGGSKPVEPVTDELAIAQ